MRFMLLPLVFCLGTVSSCRFEETELVDLSDVQDSPPIVDEDMDPIPEDDIEPEAPIVFDGEINVGTGVLEESFAYRILQDFGIPSDSEGNNEVSTLRVFEDLIELGPAHSVHRDIRSDGGGRFSHWRENLYLSTSDNTDPRTNGRTYSYLLE